MTEQGDPLLNEEEMNAEPLTPEDVNTAKEFSKFMDEMADDFRTGDLEPQHVADYVLGVGGAAHAIKGIAKNEGIELPGPTDWKWMALIMATAANHS